MNESLERATSEQQEALDDLLNCSGFPEPFLRGTRTSYNRWASVYHREILRADVRDVSGGRDLDTVEMLYHLLIPRVGSPLSIAQLMGPLKTAHRTIGSWISLFDRLQLTFRLKPFSRRINRSILKEAKLYFIDYARVRNEGNRFENLIAVELKRATLNWTDFGLGNYELWYLRTKDGEEVDFLVTRDGDPWFLVEAKLNEAVPITALRKFQSQLHVPAVQLVRRSGIQRVLSNEPDRILVCDAASWLPGLG